MSKLLLTKPKGKSRSFDLVPSSNSQWPNEIERHQLDQINKILPPEILSEMAARKLAVPPREIALLLSRLKAAEGLKITIED